MCVYIFWWPLLNDSQINVHSLSVPEVQIYLGTQRYLMQIFLPYFVFASARFFLLLQLTDAGVVLLETVFKHAHIY